MDASTLGATVHHVNSRQVCAGCQTRVFTYATDTASMLHYCTACADRKRGVPICGGCQRPVVQTATGWTHIDQATRHYGHPATLEDPNPTYRRGRTL